MSDMQDNETIGAREKFGSIVNITGKKVETRNPDLFVDK
jgi:hypothetical protein